MLLETMANYIGSKCGQVDDVSIALIKGFINARLSMIWDSYAWQDTEATALVSIDSTSVFNVPEEMDRVISIRSDGETFLDPVDMNLLFQTDPQIFERIGPPTCYRSYNDGDDRKIQIFPTPADPINLFIVGKRSCVPLTNGHSEPLIRNIDNCLIAYATGDLLERQRQYAKAAAKFTEASAMLQAAQALEANQSNQPRQIKQLTVAGNSLAELTDQVCALTGQWSRDSIILIKNFLRGNYQALWDMCNWSEATVQATVNNDGPEVILPVFFSRVISVRFDPSGSALNVIEPQLVYGVNPQLFEQTGNPVAYSYLTSVGVKFLPPTREQLASYSTSSADRGNVFVMGEIRGEIVSENVQLNGTVPVATVNQYDTPLTVSKGITKGDVQVLGYDTSVKLERILSNERERRHIRLWLQPKPSSSQVLMILGKRVMTPFAQDEDTTLLRDCGAALIAGAAADMFAKVGNDKAAADQRAQASAAIKTLLDLETRQGAFSQQIIPEMDNYSYHPSLFFSRGGNSGTATSLMGETLNYLREITGYTGGGSTNADGISSSGVSTGTMYYFVVGGQGAEWRLQDDTDPTDVDAGIIRLLDSGKNLVRVGGL